MSNVIAFPGNKLVSDRKRFAAIDLLDPFVTVGRLSSVGRAAHS